MTTWTDLEVGGSIFSDLEASPGSATVSAGNVSFIQSGTGATETTVQADLRARPVVVTTQFGVTGDGVTDDTAAIQAAIDAHPGRVLLFPKGTYLVSNITINRPVVIAGESVSEDESAGKTQVGTRFLAKTGSTGSMFTIDRGTTYWNYENQLYGVAFKSIFIDGNERGVSVSAFDMTKVDRLVLEDVNIQHVKYQALRFNTAVRESWFVRVRTRFCGSADDDKPVIDLREQSTSDGHNNIVFQDCQIIFSMGNTVEIEKFSGSTTAPRNITFSNCMVHGIVPSLDGAPYTFTTAQKAIQHLVIGDVDMTGVARINSVNTRWFVSGDAVSTIELTSDADNALLTISGGEVSSHYGSTGNYHGISVGAGSVLADNLYSSGNNRPIVQTGGNVYLTQTCFFSGNANGPTLIANSTTQQWYISTVNMGSGGTIAGLGNLEVGNVKSQTTALALVLQALQDSVATSFSIQSKDGSGNLGNRLTVGAGAAGSSTLYIRQNIPVRLLQQTVAPNVGMTADTGDIQMYTKGKKIIFAFNDGGTVRYKYLDLSGTGVTWVHDTAAP